VSNDNSYYMATDKRCQKKKFDKTTATDAQSKELLEKMAKTNARLEKVGAYLEDSQEAKDFLIAMICGPKVSRTLTEACCILHPEMQVKQIWECKNMTKHFRDDGEIITPYFRDTELKQNDDGEYFCPICQGPVRLKVTNSKVSSVLSNWTRGESDARKEGFVSFFAREGLLMDYAPKSGKKVYLNPFFFNGLWGRHLGKILTKYSIGNEDWREMFQFSSVLGDEVIDYPDLFDINRAKLIYQWDGKWHLPSL